MAALLARNHRVECAGVLPLSSELPGFGRNDGRARGRGGSFHDPSVGIELRSRTRQTSSTASESDKRLVAGG